MLSLVFGKIALQQDCKNTTMNTIPLHTAPNPNLLFSFPPIDRTIVYNLSLQPHSRSYLSPRHAMDDVCVMATMPSSTKDKLHPRLTWKTNNNWILKKLIDGILLTHRIDFDSPLLLLLYPCNLFLCTSLHLRTGRVTADLRIKFHQQNN